MVFNIFVNFHDEVVRLYFLYLDGSGNPSLKDETDQFYALGGVALDEQSIKHIEAMLSIEKYFPDTENRPEELKLSSIHHGRWWRTVPQDIKNKIIDDVVKLVIETNTRLFAVVIDKKEHKEKYISPEDPCILALRLLLTRYSKSLKRLNTYGTVIYDKDREREIFMAVKNWKSGGLVMKSYLNPFLKDEVPEKFIETIFFIDSKYSPCMWITDFWARSCYLNKKRGNYFLFDKMKVKLDEFGYYEHPRK